MGNALPTRFWFKKMFSFEELFQEFFGFGVRGQIYLKEKNKNKYSFTTCYKWFLKIIKNYKIEMSTISQQVFGIIKLSTKVTVTFWSRIWVQKPNLTWEHEQSKVPLNASLLVILSDSCEQNKIKSCPKTDKPQLTLQK